MDIFDLRNEYKKGSLEREDLNPNPFAQFKKWFNEALDCKLEEPNAMDVATVGEGGAPDIRTVLLKSWDEKGFVFFTNYESSKARDISKNSNVALHFLWLGLERQLKILGRAEKISTLESLRYFVSRPSAPEQGYNIALAAGNEVCRNEAQVLKRRNSPARLLGRLPRNAAHIRVLARQAQPPARPLPLQAAR